MVVVVLCAGAPAGGVVPKGGELVEGLGLLAVQPREEVGVDRLAPAVAAFKGNAQRLCQKVFLGVDDVDQIPQGFRGVPPKPDVDVVPQSRAPSRRRPQQPDERLYRLDVSHLQIGLTNSAFRRSAGDAAVETTFHFLPCRQG